MRITLVEWLDSSCYNGWHRFSKENDGISHCITAGVLKYEDEEQIVISLSSSDSGNVGDTMSIPKVCITRMRNLRVKK